MSEPEEHISSGNFQESDTNEPNELNEPGEISLAELIDSRTRIAEESNPMIEIILEKNQQKEPQSSEPQSIQNDEPSTTLLQEFKIQADQAQDRYFEQEPQTYQQYVLNMEETLQQQQQYEGFGIQSGDMLNSGHNIEQKFIEINPDSNGMPKNEIQEEEKNANSEILSETLEREKTQNSDQKDDANQQTIILEIQSASDQQSKMDLEIQETSKQKSTEKCDDFQKQTFPKIVPQLTEPQQIQQLSQSFESPRFSMSQTIQQHIEHIDIDEIDHETPVFGDVNDQHSNNPEARQSSENRKSFENISQEKLNNHASSHPNEKQDHQETSNSKPHEPNHSKTISVDESEEEEIIFVPKKQPSPPQTPEKPQQNLSQSKVTAQKPTVEDLRKMLLEADTDWTDIIKSASDSQILQFYEELTNKSEMSNFVTEHYQVLNTSQIQEKTSNSQANTQQNPSPQSTQQEAIIEETTSQEVPQNAEQTVPASSILEKENTEEELQALISVLTSTSPQLSQQIKKLSQQQLFSLYHDTVNTIREDKEDKPKKKKSNNKPVIDLEDESQNQTKDQPPNENSQKSALSSSKVTQQPQPKSSFSYLAQYHKRRSESQKKITPAKVASPIYVNKTLLYQLIRSHDFEKKLKSIIMPKESAKYQEKTEKEIAMLYLNYIRKHKVKGPFQSKNKQGAELVLLCPKNLTESNLKNEQFKKFNQQRLSIEINQKIMEQKKRKIIELRQRRTQGTEGEPQMVPRITSLPSSIPAPPVATPMPGQFHPPTKKRYCLIVQELESRDEEQIGLQKQPKRVKKSTGEIEDKEILSLLKNFEKLIGTQQIELEE